jgi:predicted DNA-binding transcriptional regulator AlpA
MKKPKKTRLLRWPAIQDRLDGVSYPQIIALMDLHGFPKSRVIGRRVAWLEHEVEKWLLSRPVTVRPRGTNRRANRERKEQAGVSV